MYNIWITVFRWFRGHEIVTKAAPGVTEWHPLGSLWYPFKSSFSIFWCGSITNDSLHISSSSRPAVDQIRSRCIALGECVCVCVSECKVRMWLKDRTIDQARKARKWKGILRMRWEKLNVELSPCVEIFQNERFIFPCFKDGVME